MNLQGGGIQGPGAGTACPAEGLAGRHILLGITGSIAAYKAAVLCRLLRTAGAEVRVVMTPLAKQFITPLTMATLSRNPILVEFFDPENGAWNSHVSLGEWADCYLIAPATANTLAKMACGIADNLLLTTYLSARCPVVVAPAMDLDRETGNVYKSINIIARRANQISTELKTELNRKLADFSSPTDTMEETFENREQIEISRYYERLPKPVIIATEEFLDHELVYKEGKDGVMKEI